MDSDEFQRGLTRDEQIERRLKRAEETKAALMQVRANRTPENVAALHRLHARHLREDGDLAGAAEADERAERARGLLRPTPGSAPE